MRERKFFWCSGNYCGNTFGSHPVGHKKQPTSELAQELKGKSLCRNCYDKGLRLRMEPTVYQTKGVKQNAD